jgi:heat shock protein HslJ
MNAIPVSLAVLIVAAVIVTACTTAAPAPQPAATTPLTVTTAHPAAPAIPPNLIGKWIITSMAIQGGTAVIQPEAEITLYFNSDGTLSGNGGCNNYFGSFELTGQTTEKGDGIAIGPLGMTEMYCPDYSDQENLYLGVLQKVIAFDIDGSQLALTASDGSVLIYQTPASLVTPPVYPHPA